MRSYLRLFVILLGLYTFETNILFSQEYTTDANTVAIYHFNETSGNTVFDESGNGNNGTAYGTTIVDGKFGKARYFNGISDWVQVPNSSSLQITNAITVEAWINLTVQDSSWRSFVSKISEGYGIVHGYDLRMVRGNPILTLVIPEGVFNGHEAGGYPIPLNTWVHLASTYDGALVKLYMNGLKIYEASQSGQIAVGNEDVFIGKQDVTSNDRYTHTMIDEIRISNKAREPWEFNVPGQYGLIAYYPFNGNANDESGNGNNGTVGGAVLTKDRFLIDNAAYHFEGSSYISIPELFPSEQIAFTISAWVSWDGFSTTDQAIYYKGSIQGEVGFGTEGTDSLMGFGVKLSNNTWYKLDALAPPELNHYYHVLARYQKGNVIDLWVDGVKVDSLTIPNLDLYVTSPSTTSSIGAVYGGTANFLRGTLDEVRVYDRALTVPEIDSLYHEGGWPYPLTVTMGFITTQVLDTNYAIITTATVQVFTSEDSLLGNMQYHPPGDPYDGYYRFIVPDITKNYVVKCLLPDSVYSQKVGGPDSTIIHSNIFPVISSDFFQSWNFNGVDQEAYPRIFIKQKGGESTLHGTVAGTVFDDTNWNGIKDTGEVGLADWKIKLSGAKVDSTYTDEGGHYILTELDSGMYTISEEQQIGWIQTFPESEIHTINLGIRDSVVGVDFGNFQLGTISGLKYKDVNRNGAKDIDEPGIQNWIIRLNGILSDSTVTDENGVYTFTGLPIGTYTVSEDMKQGWEQIYPESPGTHTVNITISGQEFTDVNFGNAVTVPKVKLPLSFYNADKSAVRNIYWGIRSGAARGIWGIDPSATSADSTEGESELPPPLTGTFDARFINPDRTPNYFGNGSWVDVRNFVSSSQSDTYKISFQAGPIGYPVTFKWLKELVNQSFGGIVRIGKNPGNWVDMKLVDSLVITNVNMSTLYIISDNPTIPILYNKGWNMISLPMMLTDTRKEILFPTSVSNLYKFDNILGYVTSDSLEVGSGYWIKFNGVVPPLVLDGVDVLSNTINVFSGWNLIGSLYNPIPVNSIESDPPGIIMGGFFRYDNSYYSADTLKPFMGYWVKVNQGGQLILSSPIK